MEMNATASDGDDKRAADRDRFGLGGLGTETELGAWVRVSVSGFIWICMLRLNVYR